MRSKVFAFVPVAFCGFALLLFANPAARASGEASFPADEPGATKAAQAIDAGDPAVRVRELIYRLRQFRPGLRDDQWGQAIHELYEIGKPAVPELVAELDQTDGEFTLRSVALALRAIGDPRAVPGLIRAIPKTLRAPRSDFGLQIADPQLRAFLQKHHWVGSAGRDFIHLGRPVNEIFTTLEHITRHAEGVEAPAPQQPAGAGRPQPAQPASADKLIGMTLQGTPEELAGKRRLFDERCDAWLAWWKKHSTEFVSEAELRSVELPRHEGDPVDAAGRVKFGPIFPSGPDFRLGAVREALLDSDRFADGKSSFDLDTNRFFEAMEGIARNGPVAVEDRKHLTKLWQHKTGVDLAVNALSKFSGYDLQLWPVDDNRWSSLETEIPSERPFDLGEEKPSLPDVGTFLFTTREGGAGVLRMLPRDPETASRRLQYRLVERRGTSLAPAPPPAEKQPPSKTRFGGVLTTTLAQLPQHVT